MNGRRVPALQGNKQTGRRGEPSFNIYTSYSLVTRFERLSATLSAGTFQSEVTATVCSMAQGR
jgi:hypothetical protein